jgi:hypothetical protein
MSVFITIIIRKTVTARTITARKTRKGGDTQMPIRMETGDLVKGRRTSQDQPRNTNENDCYDSEHRHRFPFTLFQNLM